MSIKAPLIKLNSGHSIPGLGLGVYQSSTNVVGDIVIKALNLGYRHIDSAIAYGNEKEAADAIAKWISQNPSINKRSDVFYTTKIRDQLHGYETTKKAIAESLEKAGAIEYIDLFLIHSPQSDYEKRHGTWKALEEAVESGKVKSIGVSNYGVKHLKELLSYPDLKIKPAVNQIELHPWLLRSELTQFLRDEGIAIEAYSPLARGEARNQKINEPLIKELADKNKISNAQVLIAWSLSKGFIPLPKTVTESRLLPNLQSLEIKLSEDDIKKLDGLDEYGVTGWDPTVYPLDNEKK